MARRLVAGAVEKPGTGCGRVRLGVIEDVGAETLKAFLTAGVAPATTAHTDGWRGYAKLDRSGYRHVASVIQGSGADGLRNCSPSLFRRERRGARQRVFS